MVELEKASMVGEVTASNMLVLKRHWNRHLFDFHISAIFVMPVGNPTYPTPIPGSQPAPMAFSVCPKFSYSAD
uniref:Uncharacterized protein n=1 Tax=Oryza barthii TaxID=65489 RepID=A0A0D3HT82_9ORYZ